MAAPLFPAQLSLGTFAASLLFIPHHAPGMAFGIPLNPIGWTLQYELVFYPLFALALALPRRIGIALIAAILGLWVVAVSRGLLGHDNALAYLGRPIILYFLAAMALGVVRERWRGNAAGPLAFAVSLGIAAAAMAAACASRFLPGLAPSSTTAILAVATVIAVSACAFSRNAASGGRAQSVSRAVGDATYSIYLTHLLPLALLAVAMPAAVSAVALAVFVPVGSLVAVGSGLLI
ncbi:acyltransferase family protein [Allosphingosinicella deserti]|uniref:acyltransferase family protein n=1 Tax=Allosphingosinicella deserti TaxID=2116704 RepID=UPI001E5762F2|nr:acyltransferase family protein [Sphingomonas deserti]